MTARTACATIIVASWLFLLSSSALAAEPASVPTVQDVVSQVEGHYAAMNDLTAKTVQKNVLKAINKIQSFEGTLLIKKPGKLRLDYTNGQVILVDGKAALFYSKKSEEVIKKTFSDFEHMNIPVAFLLGAAHIRDDFDVLQPDTAAPRALELSPKRSGAAMKKLGLQVDDQGRIEVLTIYDRSGNETTITFSEVRENSGVADKAFAFKPPKGTTIIQQ